VAVILPDSPLYYDTGSNGEMKIYDALKAKLDDDWMVIHSFRWVKLNSSTGRKAQGEGDFVLFHKDIGVLVIEVKGGDVEYRNRVWTSTDENGKQHRIQDPEKQANDTKYQIIDRLRSNGLPNIPVFHSVWFPDVEVKSEDLKVFPANYNQEIVFDSKSLNDPNPAIETAFAYWFRVHGFLRSTFSLGTVQKVKQLLSPQIRLVKTLKRMSDDINDTYIRLNAEQIRLLENLSMCKELSIIGRAGTGKTIIAIEKARLAAEQGKKVLLLCFNTELAKKIAEVLDGKVKTHTIHAFALEYMKKHYPGRVQGDFETDSDFDYLISEFIEVSCDALEKYDTIIIDEGQDFKESWIVALRHFSDKEGTFYIFYDPLQNLYSSETEFNDTYIKFGVPFLLLRNMRNTDEISRSSLNILCQPLQNEYFNGIRGKEPEIIFVNDKYDLENKLSPKLHSLQYIERMDSKQITVLTLDSLSSSWLSSDFIEDTIPNLTTVRKFKGLENDVILITDADLSHLVDPVKQRLLYVAISRAKVHAVIFFHIDKRYTNLACNKFKCLREELPDVITDYFMKGDIQ
jgi:hypothetical protein